MSSLKYIKKKLSRPPLEKKEEEKEEEASSKKKGEEALRKARKKNNRKESKNDMSLWMEYRADVDDAWYSVRVVAEENGDVLRVKFCVFSDKYDKILRGSE